jgi:hypothetical protein
MTEEDLRRLLQSSRRIAQADADRILNALARVNSCPPSERARAWFAYIHLLSTYNLPASTRLALTEHLIEVHNAKT